MAIRIPDLGTGSGAVGDGDNELKIRQDYNHNFNDQTNAASRLVGPAAGNVMEVGAFGWGANNKYTAFNPAQDANTTELAKTQMYQFTNVAEVGYGAGLGWSRGNIVHFLIGGWEGFRNLYHVVTKPAAAEGTRTVYYQKIRTEANTSVDANGFIKAASPVVKVFADKVELNGEAENQDVTYKKNGIGDYTITTVSGLSTDGWYIELPKDMNGNPKVAVTLSEVDGVISLKSYKRIFSMGTFTFEPDLNEPLDIPDGRWIDLRLNENPVEPSEPESEV